MYGPTDSTYYLLLVVEADSGEMERNRVHIVLHNEVDKRAAAGGCHAFGGRDRVD